MQKLEKLRNHFCLKVLGKSFPIEQKCCSHDVGDVADLLREKKKTQNQFHSGSFVNKMFIRAPFVLIVLAEWNFQGVERLLALPVERRKVH